MKVLLYMWGSYCDAPLIQAMEKLGIETTLFKMRIRDYHADAEFARQFLAVLHKENVDLVLSFDYFPIVASLCNINNVRYYSWIYDCPLRLLNSKTLTLDTNYVFCFDRDYVLNLQQRGAKHCFHFPLGVSIEYFAKEIEATAEVQKKNYQCDVSFVGNFYNGEKNRLRNAKLSPYSKGYVEALTEAQGLIYGYSFIAEALPEKVVEEVASACELQMGELYEYTDRQLVADTIGIEVSAKERERMIMTAAELTQVHVYTGSELPESLRESKNVINCGFADNKCEMPLIFHESKINLNMTSHTITSGIPQRVLDILACEGFCLTNYQLEIAEYFTDGEELVMYTSKEDAKEKIAYYLAHEEERKEIARRGYEKIVAQFTMEKRVGEMLKMNRDKEKGNEI